MMVSHANSKLQSMRKRCPDPVIIEHAKQLGMTVLVHHDRAGHISGTAEQWEDLETVLFSTDRVTLSELQVKYS